MPDRLLVDLGGDGRVGVLSWPAGGLPEDISGGDLAWPLDGDALEDLRWYLEDYLLAPFGVWEERGPAVRARLAAWGEQVFRSVFGDGPARLAYERARDRGLEVVFRSAEPGLLASFPAARRRRERRSFGELLDWLDGHPLAMRLTLPRLQDTDPNGLLADLRGTAPLPPAEGDLGTGRLSSLGACITYSYAHLAEPARRLLPWEHRRHPSSARHHRPGSGATG